MSASEADRGAWLLVLSFVFGCNVLRILLPSLSSFVSRVLQKDAEHESQMRAEIQDMKQELSTVNMMDEFARYARLERKINKMTDKLKTHVKARTAQLAKIKWFISVAFYILQAALMISLIWKYYSVPVAVVPSKWITPLDRLVAFPTRVADSLPKVSGDEPYASCGALFTAGLIKFPSVLPAYVPVGQKRAPDLITDGCEPPCVCQELNSGPLEE